MKQVIFDRLGQLAVIVTILLLSPLFIIVGGVLCMWRYYKFVSDTVNNKTPKKYYF